MTLQYFLSEKERLVVASLSGIVNGDQGPVLHKCYEDTIAKAPLGVVLNVSSVHDFPKDGFRGLVTFLRGLKSKCAYVRIYCPDVKLQKLLVAEGLVSASELRASLPEALRELAGLVRPTP